jgi:two-component system, chemotaxis family, CheB/CheR fusion protein
MGKEELVKSQVYPEDQVEPAPVEQGSGAENFPVVGIGASAGGLEALSELFSRMSENTGAGFVVVQHLAPSKNSAMPELLSRNTRMRVFQVTDNMPIKRNTIYLIPPGKNMSVVNGSLQLLEQIEPSGIRHPIDFFFKSLALDRRSGAIGVVLSGTGTDGTAGARAIKSELGLVIAQQPEDAKYDGMPRSVIDSGLTDYVLAAADIPDQIVKYIRGIPDILDYRPEETDDLSRYLPKIITLIRNETGNDFSSYKENTLFRRIRRRMAIHQIRDPGEYVRFLQNNPSETTVLFKELLINVTSFFRDKEAFEALKRVMKSRLESKPPEEEIRVWVVGCATGEEAYSIAIVIRECLDELEMKRKVQIFATDLDSDAIDTGRNGIYRPNISDDMSVERLKTFFVRQDENYRVIKEIREMVIFATHNLIKEPPFLRTDLISARNLLIYLKSDIQKRIIPIFRYSLSENGILFLSPSETVGEFTDLFSTLDRKWKIYQVKGPAVSNMRIPQFPLQTFASKVRPMGQGSSQRFEAVRYTAIY